MTKEKLKYYLKDLNRAVEIDSNELDLLIAKHPNVEIFHLLKAKKESFKQSPVEGVFHNAAMHSTDRKKLYFNLNERDLTVVKEEKQKTKKRKQIKAEKKKSKLKKKKKEKTDNTKSKTKNKKSKKLKSLSIEEENKVEDSFTAWLANLNQQIKETENAPELPIPKEPELVIEKSTKEFAQNSVEINDYIISEPLAALLAQQGHKKKAIEMYSKLSLIFPEKSGYFAVQIEKIKKK